MESNIFFHCGKQHLRQQQVMPASSVSVLWVNKGEALAFALSVLPSQLFLQL